MLTRRTLFVFVMASAVTAFALASLWLLGSSPEPTGSALARPASKTPVDHVVLEVESVQTTFLRVNGLETTTEVVEHMVNVDGQQVIEKLPGTHRYSNIILTRDVIGSDELWEWRELVLDGKVDQARRDGIIHQMDAENQALVSWQFKNGWPCRYTGGPRNARETIEICHEELIRLPTEPQ